MFLLCVLAVGNLLILLHVITIHHAAIGHAHSMGGESGLNLRWYSRCPSLTQKTRPLARTGLSLVDVG